MSPIRQRQREKPSALRSRIEGALVGALVGLFGAGLWFFVRRIDFLVPGSLLGGLGAILGFVFGPRAGHIFNWVS